MINNSHIFYNFLNLVVRRADRSRSFFFFSREFVFWSCYVCVGGGGVGEASLIT